MSNDFTTTCPTCGTQHDIPYKEVRHHVYHLLGKERARKRKDGSQHIKKMQAKMKEKQHGRLSAKQQAILDLAQHEDLELLKLREIADKVGITGKHRVTIVWAQLDKLKKKGLLTLSRRIPAFPIDQS
jgi:hypothetical protein